MLETKSIADLVFTETPRKRKRETAAPPPPTQQQPPERGIQVRQDAAAAVVASESCFTNAAFSSTPKKLIGRRRLAKENSNPFPGLEVKSIADLAEKQEQRQQQQQVQLPTNPFEVLRQPPKKKKREQQPACFENPGLNLELPEKQFNPYEVIRLATTPSKGFVNPALNLRGSDAPASLNPFEIHRPSEASAAACNPAGVTNPALAERDTEEPLPTSLKIGLPFAPNVGYRIDFHGLSLAQLTPSKLLAEKLVFSPVPAPKRSLGAISEESTMDIGKELDRYQLELENSINEAKLRKNGVVLERDVARKSLDLVSPKVSLVMETDSQELMMQQVVTAESQVERRLVCTRRRTLTEISEAPEVDQREQEQGEEDKAMEQERQQMERERELEQERRMEREKLLEREKQSEREKLQEKLHEQLREKLQERVKLMEREKQKEELQEKEKLLEQEENLLEGDKEADHSAADVAYASESDEEPDDLVDFKAPARFVRAYRPAALPTKAASKESLHSIGSSKSGKSGDVKTSTGGGMKGMIRKSIRRLMHPTQHTSPEKPEEIREHHNILTSIRHSLRRRPQKAAVSEAEMEPGLPDISIIDTSERTMKLRSSVAQTEYMTIDQLTNEKKHTLRNSIRRSTRDVLRHVFHKSHDAYATAK
ncbi:calponin homology domain-containing protein DDB_G0272472 [Drosophila serrata]|uniref:calponin homology domain-containing protein DDB_G0272472 n=1 Tax=Drosophila serrata TaxID=7274 RepID=UPI000A1D1BE2|nr:calponin homology domain-containing protein DDB_G0272472 [Drosophila serrata]